MSSTKTHPSKHSIVTNYTNYFFLWHFDPILGHGLPLQGFVITLIGQTTLGRTPVNEWSAQCRELSLTTHNTHKRQTSMPPAGFKLTIPASKRTLTYTLDCMVTRISYTKPYCFKFQSEFAWRNQWYKSSTWMMVWWSKLWMEQFSMAHMWYWLSLHLHM